MDGAEANSRELLARLRAPSSEGMVRHPRCHCNRPTLETMRAAGFETLELERDTMRKTPPIVRPLIVGVAESGAAPG